MSETASLARQEPAPVTFTVSLDALLIRLSDAQLRAECERRGLLPRQTEALDGAVLRAARGLLDWSLADLAAASRLSVSTLKRIEDDAPGRTQLRKRDALRRALWDAGVRLTDVDGNVGVYRVPPPRSN